MLCSRAAAPSKGSAILWPSVLSSDPYTTDDRTYHEAVPVAAGLKYAANFWSAPLCPPRIAGQR